MSRKILLLMVLLVLVPLMTVSLGSEVEFDVPNWAVEVAPFKPIPLYAVVEVDALNLRDAPSTDGEKIGVLHKGDRVELLAWAVGYYYTYWREDAYKNSDYLWAEVRFGDQRGFVAAEEAECGFGGYDKERYLTVEHDFGELELYFRADVDGDGIKENIYVGTGDVHVDYENFYYDKSYIYRLPLLMTIEDADDYLLADFYLGNSEEKLSFVEFVVGEDNFLDRVGKYYGWSLYDLRAEDVNGDGMNELQLTLDLRSTGSSPVMPPTFTNRRTRGFSVQGGQIKEIYNYTDYAFIPVYDDGHNGTWIEIRGEAEITPERLLYHAMVTISRENYRTAKIEEFRTIQVKEQLAQLDVVRHELPPPNYLNKGYHFTVDIEARWVDSVGIYALYCPPGNDYAGRLGHEYTTVSLNSMFQVYDSYSHSDIEGTLTKPLSLFCLPEDGADKAGVLESGIDVYVLVFESSDKDWYLIRPSRGAVCYDGELPLMGWSYVRPEFVE
jgi:hypothetical protein